MRATQPPRVATWLLRHLGSSPHNDSIIGDLVEQYQNALRFTVVREDRLRHDRRSFYSPLAIRYWKECMKAIVVGLFSECRSHKLQTAHSLIIGWAVLFLYFKTFDPVRDLFAGLQSWSRWWRHDWLFLLFFSIYVLFFCFASFLLI